MNATVTPDTGRWTPGRIAIWATVAIAGAIAWGSSPWPEGNRSTRSG